MLDFSNSIQYEDRIVAFIDILGFKELVRKGIQVAYDINEALQASISSVKETRGDQLSIKMFSDCICLSCDFSTSSVLTMLFELSFIQLVCSTKNIFLRGGLSFGKHFENDNIIFSPALIDAYEIEKKAMYPRIIIDKELINFLKYDRQDINQRYIMKAPDGEFFIDYLDFHMDSDLQSQITFYRGHKEAIEYQVNENMNDNYVLEKYHWIARYHNLKFKSLFDPSVKGYDELANYLIININEIFPSFNKTIFG